MSDITKIAQGTEFERQISAESVQEVVSTLYTELHHAQADPGAVGPNSRLDRDLGFDSLGRVELVLRLEQRFGVHLPSAALSLAETVADLIALVNSAANAGGIQPRFAAVPSPNPTLRPLLGTPRTATTLNEVLAWHAERHPQATHAVVLGDEQAHTVTYAQLAEGAKGIAGALKHAGVQPGVSVALMLPTAVEYLYAFFGILLAGAMPVPIYPPTHASQIEEHVHRHAGVLSNAAVYALITVPEARIVAHLLRAKAPSLRHILSVAELAAQREPFQPLRSPPSAESIAMLQYTSGSTGSPKGVVLTHANLLANIRTIGSEISVNESDVFVSWLPLYHDMGLIGAWLGSLYFGCLLVIMPPTAFLTRPARWLQAIRQYRGTLTASPNFGYELCARRLTDSDVTGLDLSSLRIAFNGAEPVYPDTLQRFDRRFAPYGFRAEAMTPVYGLAEAAVGLTFPPMGRGPIVDGIDRSTMMRERRAVSMPPDAPNVIRFVSCGRPLPGYRLRILDETGTEVPERVEGVLQFTGPSATSGYFHNPEATARLVHGEWRDTGDRAYLAAGELYITGRVKDMIIRRGQHIYPDEIENAIGELAGVRKGCVVTFGTKEPTTATEKLVVLAETRLTDASLRTQLKTRINECVVTCIGEPPEEVVLAAPHTVLKTSSGKLRRAATRAAYEDRSLGHAPPSPVVQMLRLVIEGAMGRLQRAREAGAHAAYGLYVWSVLFVIGIPAGLRIALCREPAQAWHLTHRVASWLVRAWSIPFSVKWETAIDLPVPHVIVANHCSYMDSIFAAALLPQPHIMVAKAELQRIPVVRAFLRALGTIFVERSARGEHSSELEQIRQALARGTSIFIFPEGTFTPVTGLRPFQLGAFEIAVATGSPVIPVSLYGTRLVLRDGQRLPRRLPVGAVVGAPLVMPSGDEAFAAAVQLRDTARAEILRHCGEPDLI